MSSEPKATRREGSRLRSRGQNRPQRPNCGLGRARKRNQPKRASPEPGHERTRCVLPIRSRQ